MKQAVWIIDKFYYIEESIPFLLENYWFMRDALRGESIEGENE